MAGTTTRSSALNWIMPTGTITMIPGVCGGDACVMGTRLTVWGLEKWRRLGLSDAMLLAYYPQLTKEDLRAAWDYVELHKQEIDRAIHGNE